MQSLAWDNDVAYAEEEQGLWRDSLLWFLAITAFLAFLWLFWLIVIMDEVRLAPTLSPFGFILSSILCAWLINHNLPLARFIFPLLILSVTALHIWVNRSPAASFLTVAVALAASIGKPRGRAILITGIACTGLGLAALLSPEDVGNIYATAMIMTLLAALAGQLMTRNLYTALHWAKANYDQAKQNMQKLRERQEELNRISEALRRNQERMHYLNIRLEQAKLAAEEAYRIKQQFVAHVSHELRTPLNLITGFSEMMAFSVESYNGVRLPKEYYEDVMEIYHSSKHLLRLIEDVLTLAQIEAGQMMVQRDWVNLVDVIRDAVETISALAEGKGLEMRLSMDPSLPQMYIDSARIRQVLLNLLNNACRFTIQGYIEIKAYQEDNQAIIEVRDTGIGIAPEHLPHLFEEFFSLSSAEAPTQSSGFGLGLAISRRLVRAHGGDISASSQLGQGSCFRISLPIVPQEAAEQASMLRHTPSPEVGKAKPTILCVSEQGQPSNLDRYISDYHVVHVSPEEAEEAYQMYVPFAIWLNQDPFASEIPPWLGRLLRASPSLPVVRCRVPTEQDVARRFQVDAFLPKPITRSQVVDVITRLRKERPIHKVLIVDDDPRVVRMAKRMLATTGEFEIIEACGGQEALDLLGQAPDLVLLDLAMPGVSGYDVLKAILQQDDNFIRIVLMTGVGVDEKFTPVYALSVESREGFPAVKCLQLLNHTVNELSISVRQSQQL